MAQPVLQIGNVALIPSDRTYRDLRRESEQRWTQLDVLSGPPLLHYVGEGMTRLQITGTFYPFAGAGLEAVEALRAEQDRKVPLPVIDGLDLVLMHVVIDRVTESWEAIAPLGLPRRQPFEVAMRRHPTPIVPQTVARRQTQLPTGRLEAVELLDNGTVTVDPLPAEIFDVSESLARTLDDIDIDVRLPDSTHGAAEDIIDYAGRKGGVSDRVRRAVEDLIRDATQDGWHGLTPEVASAADTLLGETLGGEATELSATAGRAVETLLRDAERRAIEDLEP